MEQKLKVQQRMYLLLSDLYEQFKTTPFHYVEFEKKCNEYRLIKSVSTGIVRTGLGVKVSKGYYALRNKPVENDGNILYDKLRSMAEASTSARLRKRQNQIPLKLETTEVNRVELNDEYCIEYLKKKGYKVMKAVTEYKEL